MNIMEHIFKYPLFGQPFDAVGIGSFQFTSVHNMVEV
jgi:hypothetical protein